MKFATRAIRVAQTPVGPYKPVVLPLYQSSTFAWNSLEDIPAIDYTRVANPSRQAVEEIIASLENGKFATAFASGMAAITATMSLAKQGDHVVIATDIYGGTLRLCEQYLPAQGITYGTFDMCAPETLDEALQPNTKLVIFESPTNPTLRICDISAIVARCKAAGVHTVFDNTFASPALQNPLDMGVDVVVHSTTKYIGGHSDVVGGVAVTNSQELATAFFEWNKMVGSNPGPFDCWMLIRGVKTLGIRVERSCENALALARFLSSHPKVRKVNYPGLENHPGHEIAARQMRAFGGMLSFEVDGGYEEARRVCEGTKVFILAESLGAVESLIGYPSLMSHAGLTEEQRCAIGIPPGLVRLSIGIEDISDLIDDLDQALAKI